MATVCVLSGFRATLHRAPVAWAPRQTARCGHHRPAVTASAAGAAGTSSDGAADAFLQSIKALSAGARSADEAAQSSSGCCGGSGGGESVEAAAAAATGASKSGGCGCSSTSSGAAAAAGSEAAAAAAQLSSMLGGLEGTLSREEMQQAFQAGRTEGGDGSGGERFLDVAAILRGGSGEEAEQDDADLDALVV